MSNEDYGGVYRIVNNVNYKLYIGSSIHVNRRIYTHIQALNGKYHGNTHLQNAWDKYGGENFSFETIEIIDGSEEDIRKREQYWLDYYQSYDYNLGYNMSHYAIGGGGYEVSDDTRKKLSEAHKGKTHSEKTKKKMSEIKQGEYNPFYGKSHTKETRMKMRASHISEKAPLAKLTEEDAIQAVANYFNENPNAIVTNDELTEILDNYSNYNVEVKLCIYLSREMVEARKEFKKYT